MKKIIIIVGIILTSGIAALALSNKSTDTKVTQIKTELSQSRGHEFVITKNNIANAD